MIVVCIKDIEGFTLNKKYETYYGNGVALSLPTSLFWNWKINDDFMNPRSWDVVRGNFIGVEDFRERKLNELGVE